MTSKKCQNKLKQVSLLKVDSVRPRNKTCPSITSIHNSPQVMCKPCVPTNVKNEDKKALFCQLFPARTKSVNSVSSNVKKEIPRIKVMIKKVIVSAFLCVCAAIIARPHVKLLVSRMSVSDNAKGKLNRSRAEGPPKV